MVPTMPPGYVARVVAETITPEGLNYFQAQELSLPEASRLILEVPLDPSEDISSIAQQLEAACVANSIPTWPEYSTHTFTENSTIYIAYQKQGYQAQIAHLIPIIIGITLIASITLWLCSETFRDIIQLVIIIPIMLIMVKMVTGMTKSLKPGYVKPPKEKLPPIEERVTARLEALGERIARISHLVTVSVPQAAGEVTSVASGIFGVARSVKSAPETVMSGYEKTRSAEKMSSLYRRLAEYESYLTEDQLRKLEEERKIVEELRRAEY